MNLTPNQKRVLEQTLNVFETGSVAGDYSNISIFADGPGNRRQVTYGRSQTTEWGNLRELVQMYVAAPGAKFAAELKPFVAQIGKTSLVDNGAFKSWLKRAGKEDPVMKTTQDAFFDKRYFAPAMAWADANGFILPLSALVIYDSFIHSGGILQHLRMKFRGLKPEGDPTKEEINAYRRARRLELKATFEKTLAEMPKSRELPPSKGGDEKAWIKAYTQARQNWLANHPRKILNGTIYRTKCFLALIDAANWNLLYTFKTQGVLVPGAAAGGASA